jgi:hypothetical protein
VHVLVRVLAVSALLLFEGGVWIHWIIRDDNGFHCILLRTGSVTIKEHTQSGSTQNLFYTDRH